MPTVRYVSRKYLKEHGLEEASSARTRCNSNNPPVSTPLGESSSKHVCKETKTEAKVAAKQSKNQSSDQHSFIIEGAATKKMTTSEAMRHHGHSFARKSNQTIWVKIGKTNHPAYELLDLGKPAAVNDGDVTWVEWQSSGEKQCVQTNQIEQELRPRKRRKPSYYASSKSNP